MSGRDDSQKIMRWPQLTYSPIVTVLTLAVAALGAGIAWALSAPIYMLLGPAVAVSMAGLAGLRTGIDLRLRDTCFLILGIAVGGGFDQDLNQKQTRSPIRNEARPTAKNLRGTIAMARTSSPDSATSQFFINLTDNDFLNAGVRGPGYAVFGKVTGGMGVVDAIAGKKTVRSRGMADVPQDPIIIRSVSVRKTDTAAE